MARGYDSGVLRQMQTVFSVGAVGGLTDGQLLERFLAGPDVAAEGAFSALVERHGPLVLSVCRGVLKDRHDAEDAFQATFLVLARKAGSIRTRDSMNHWLYGVARRVALRAKTQKATHRKASERRAAEQETEWYAADESTYDELSVLHEEIARLHERHRGPLILCYLEGMTYETAARRLRVTEGTVRGRLARARELLRTRLTRRGLAFSAGLLAAPVSGRALAAIPAGLLESTVQAATGFASGKSATAAAVSASVVTLTEGVLKAMRYSQWMTIGSAVLALGVMGIGAAAWAQQGTNGRPAAMREDLTAGFPDVTSLVSEGQVETGNAQEGGDKIDEQLAAAVPGRIVRSSPTSKDCMVLSYIPEWNLGNVDNIGIANNDGGVRTYLSWPTISAKDAASPDRRFLIALYSRKTDAHGETGPIHAYQVVQEWPERTSWKTQPDYDRNGSTTYDFVPGDGWKLFDITPLIQAQAKAGKSGQGVLIRFETEDRPGQKMDWSGYQFVSREGDKEWKGRRPLLLVVEPKAR
jgi:RNA polymerase sigma factor (sigma-70 family)